MKRWFVTGTFLAALLISGCTASPAAVQGPAGPPGPQGNSAPDQDRDRDKDRDRNRDQDRDRDADRQAKGAPCPDGEHLVTNPDDRSTSCVRN